LSIHIEFNLPRKNGVDKAGRVRGQKPKGMYQPHTSYTVRFPNLERDFVHVHIHVCTDSSKYRKTVGCAVFASLEREYQTMHIHSKQEN